MDDVTPLFPLGLVALPAEAVPLHVFEPRYRIMFAELIESDGVFGIVWAGEDGLREIGCACRIEQVLERHDDGRLDVLCRGETPIALAGELHHVPYPAARVIGLSDEPEAPATGPLARAHAAFLTLADAVMASRPDDEELATMGAFALAARVDLSPGFKQQLLELRSETARLDLLAEEFDRLREDLDPDALEQARSRSNGRVRL
ncbi:MAG: LON peptidase substrate-binding domain-containing protein [Solirubrobacteraceae bacterium]